MTISKFISTRALLIEIPDGVTLLPEDVQQRMDDCLDLVDETGFGTVIGFDAKGRRVDCPIVSAEQDFEKREPLDPQTLRRNVLEHLKLTVEMRGGRLAHVSRFDPIGCRRAD